MEIDDKTLDYICDLAKVKLEGEMRETIRSDFEKIIQYMEILKEADTSSQAPLSHVFSNTDVSREDTAEDSFDNTLLLANAPQQKDGYFVVPKTLD